MKGGGRHQQVSSPFSVNNSFLKKKTIKKYTALTPVNFTCERILITIGSKIKKKIGVQSDCVSKKTALLKCNSLTTSREISAHSFPATRLRSVLKDAERSGIQKYKEFIFRIKNNLRKQKVFMIFFNT